MLNNLIFINIIIYICNYFLLYTIVHKQSNTKCKLEKVSVFLYFIILELIWIVLYNTCMFFFNTYIYLILLFYELLCFIGIMSFNEICKKIPFKFIFSNKTYYISIIHILEISVIKSYLYINRIREFLFRILKKVLQLIPIIILELICIYIFSFFFSLQDKSWDIFELMLTTIIITAYINIYNSEMERRKNLKWQYKYSYFVEHNMHNYIEKIFLLIGIHKKYDDKYIEYFTEFSKIEYIISNYNKTSDYQNFLSTNINNIEQVQKYVEDLTETFIDNLKEQRNEIIYIKENKDDEGYIYHKCIDDANKLKSKILLSDDISGIGEIIIELLPKIILDCSDILKLIKFIWIKDDIYESRIFKILQNYE